MKVEVTYPFNGDFDIDDKVTNIASQFSGVHEGSGLGPEGRELEFSFKNTKDTDRAVSKIEEVLNENFRNGSQFSIEIK